MPEMPNKEEMTSPYPATAHTGLIKHVFTTSKEPCSRKLKIRKMCIIYNCYLKRKLDYDIYALVYLLLYLIFSLFSVFLDVGLFSDSRDAEQRRDGGLFSDSRDAEQRRDGGLFSDSRDAEQRRDGSLFSDSRDAEQRRDGSLFSDSRDAEQRRDDLSLSNLDTYRVNKARVHHEERALPMKAEG